VTVGATGTVSATGGASGEVGIFTSTATSVYTVRGVNGLTVTGVTAGACVIAANQIGNTNYSAAPQVTLNISIANAIQTWR
jgi:trimeric autotransporter adhesin